LGTFCKKTIDKHLSEVGEMINKSNIILSEWISKNQNIGILPPPANINKSEIAYLFDLSDLYNQSMRKLSGIIHKDLKITNIIASTYFFNKSRKFKKKSMSCVLIYSYFFDTS
jgi:hypothetical protein